MRVMVVPVLILACIGFMLSASAHILALLGQVPPGGKLVLGLHVGIFVVWTPTVLMSTQITKNTNRKDFWKVMLSGCPSWMKYAFYGLFGYALLNFFLFATSRSGAHSRSNDINPESIRGFSGHWMVFYGVASATMYSILKSPKLLQECKCSNGHVVSSLDAFCPTCGKPLVKPNDT